MAHINLDPSDLQRGKVLSPGWYPVAVKGYQEKAAKTDGSTNYVFEFTVEGGEYDGVVLTRTFSSKAIGMMASFLEACGAKLDVKAKNTIDLDATINQKIEAHNSNREWEGKVRNDVDDFRPR